MVARRSNAEGARDEHGPDKLSCSFWYNVWQPCGTSQEAGCRAFCCEARQDLTNAERDCCCIITVTAAAPDSSQLQLLCSIYVS